MRRKPVVVIRTVWAATRPVVVAAAGIFADVMAPITSPARSSRKNPPVPPAPSSRETATSMAFAVTPTPVAPRSSALAAITSRTSIVSTALSRIAPARDCTSTSVVVRRRLMTMSP
jgi:hypothetical protein